MIKVAGELYDSFVNGPGIRYVLFTQGCTMYCKDCHNKHAWDMNGGTFMSIEDVIAHIKSSPFISGVTLSGGDPIEQPKEVSELCSRVKNDMPNLNILLYTGRTLQELREANNIYIDRILSTIDYLIDGKFDSNKINGAKKYTGSSNQKIYNLKTLKEIEFE